jgi:protein-tyrosine phosphatase
VIDLHCHVLPDVDDGVRTIDEALDLCRAAAAEGVTAIAATPHVRDDFPTSVETMEARVALVNDALREAEIDVEVLPGAELALDFLPRLSDDEVRRFGLAGNPKLLLLELPYYGWPLDIGDVIFRLRTRGVVPLMAHPERSADACASPHLLRPLAEAGAYFQITSASLDGRLGRTAQANALRMLELGFAHVIASDAHHPGIREGGFAGARAAVGDDALADWLTEGVPAALVADETPPPRPASRKRRRFPLFGRG